MDKEKNRRDKKMRLKATNPQKQNQDFSQNENFASNPEENLNQNSEKSQNQNLAESELKSESKSDAESEIETKSESKSENAFEKFFETVKAVRKGCPWDKDQTALSLRSTFFEETCEALDAITAQDSEHVKEELGDVLLNVVLIAYLFEEKNLFTVEDSINAITEKLIRRHPHVFKESEGKSEIRDEAKTSEQALSQWDRIKANVEGRKSDSVLDEVPENFPPILKSYKMLKKAAKLNFEWRSISECAEKFFEELSEMKSAREEVQSAKKYPDEKPFSVSSDSKELDAAQLHLEEEFGDALLAFINYGRWLGIDANVALQRANKKFYRRFTFVEKKMKENNIPFDESQKKQMMEFWEQAKNSGN